MGKTQPKTILLLSLFTAYSLFICGTLFVGTSLEATVVLFGVSAMVWGLAAFSYTDGKIEQLRKELNQSP